MKIKLLQTVLGLFFYIGVCSSQYSIGVDVLAHNTDGNIEYVLQDIAQDAINLKEEGCIKYSYIEDENEATQLYLIELWDSKEYVSQNIFKERRNKTVENKQGEKVKEAYTAAGINVKTRYEISGRLIERENGSVIDVFRIGGLTRREIDVDEVRKKWKTKKRDRDILNDAILEKYQNEIEGERNQIRSSYVETLFGAMDNIITEDLVPRTRITGIAEQKKDKVKKVTVAQCPETDITQYGWFYYAVLDKQIIDGEVLYREVGTCNLEDDKGILGVRKGQKELLPILKQGKELIVAKPDDADLYRLTTEKDESTKNISFVFEYELINNYDTYQRKLIELVTQSSFLGYDNISVLAKDPNTNDLNKILAREERTERNINVEEILAKGASSIVWVKVDNPKNSLAKDLKFLKSDDDPDTEYIILKSQYSDGETKINDLNQFEAFPTEIGLRILEVTIGLPNIRTNLVDTSVDIIGIEEEKKDKVKKVLVKSDVPLEKGDKYEVYDRQNFTKKTKSKAKLKIDELLSRYTAIAKVDKGDKEIKGVLNSNKELYIVREGSSSLLGKLSSIGESSGDQIPKGFVHYYRVKGSQL